jgi:hypothetical protein
MGSRDVQSTAKYYGCGCHSAMMRVPFRCSDVDAKPVPDEYVLTRDRVSRDELVLIFQLPRIARHYMNFQIAQIMT